MRCDSCKHWSKEEQIPEVERSSGLRKCEAIKFGSTITCQAMAEVGYPETSDEDEWKVYQNRIGEAYKKERAYVDDGSGYDANFYSAPDFFCAKFEQKGDLS